jgi:hypothetical protein
MPKSYIKQLEKDIQGHGEENQQLKDALKSEILTGKEFKKFSCDRNKIFTGFPSSISLMAVFDFIAPFVPKSSKCTLPQFLDGVSEALPELRRSIPYIAFQFAQFYCGAELSKWIGVMYVRL